MKGKLSCATSRPVVKVDTETGDRIAKLLAFYPPFSKFIFRLIHNIERSRLPWWSAVFSGQPSKVPLPLQEGLTM